MTKSTTTTPTIDNVPLATATGMTGQLHSSVTATDSATTDPAEPESEPTPLEKNDASEPVITFPATDDAPPAAEDTPPITDDAAPAACTAPPMACGDTGSPDGDDDEDGGDGSGPGSDGDDDAIEVDNGYGTNAVKRKKKAAVFTLPPVPESFKDIPSRRYFTRRQTLELYVHSILSAAESHGSEDTSSVVDSGLISTLRAAFQSHFGDARFCDDRDLNSGLQEALEFDRMALFGVFPSTPIIPGRPKPRHHLMPGSNSSKYKLHHIDQEFKCRACFGPLVVFVITPGTDGQPDTIGVRVSASTAANTICPMFEAAMTIYRAGGEVTSQTVRAHIAESQKRADELKKKGKKRLKQNEDDEDDQESINIGGKKRQHQQYLVNTDGDEEANTSAVHTRRLGSRAADAPTTDPKYAHHTTFSATTITTTATSNTQTSSNTTGSTNTGDGNRAMPEERVIELRERVARLREIGDKLSFGDIISTFVTQLEGRLNIRLEENLDDESAEKE